MKTYIHHIKCGYFPMNSSNSNNQITIFRSDKKIIKIVCPFFYQGKCLATQEKELTLKTCQYLPK